MYYIVWQKLRPDQETKEVTFIVFSSIALFFCILWNRTKNDEEEEEEEEGQEEKKTVQEEVKSVCFKSMIIFLQDSSICSD